MIEAGAVRVEAPAKVNLFLRVSARREDGFHDIETLFQTVDLCDELVVEMGGEGISLDVDGPDLGPVEENLVFRAARMWLDAVGMDGVRIRLTKKIPAGAGLGGGSSDAATVLKVLNRLSDGPLGDARLGHARLSDAHLAEIALALGSDVPFFLGDSSLALGRGRGEVLTPLPALPEAWLALALPPVHVPTGAAYGALAEQRAHDVADASGMPRDSAFEVLRSGAPSWDEVRRLAHNDFERVVPHRYPEVAASLDALRASGADPALLSGSGGACFGVFPTEADARHVAEELSAALGWPVLAVRTR